MSSTRTEQDQGWAYLLWHPAGAVLVRLVVGGVLVYAALHKIGHTSDLARMIYGYRVLHPELVNLLAIAMPWVEIVAGGLLVFGLLRRSSALVACVLFAAFVVAIGLAMARGIDAPCGCFSVDPEGDSIGWTTLARAAGLALLSAYLVAHPGRFAELDALWQRRRAVRSAPSPGADHHSASRC